MSEPFIAEIRIFAGNFAPRSWAFCDGQLLPVSQNTALFSLIGTTYGGDGRTTTALPNLQGRAPMQPGQGPGLTSRRLGQTGGVTTVTLSEAQMPQHSHPLTASSDSADEDGTTNVTNARTAETDASDRIYGTGTATAMSPSALDNTGGSQAHNNLQPYLVMNYIIALQGLYPSRS